MPVNIYKVVSGIEARINVAWLCDDEWLLGPQIDALTAWLANGSEALEPAEYVADVGFCWRRDASAGGPVLGPIAMRRMADLGMSVFFSEYGHFADELTDAT
jgi:hypothetical protein